MPERVPKLKRPAFWVVIGLWLIANLACGLTQGFDALTGGEPTVAPESASVSTAEEGNATIAEESAEATAEEAAPDADDAGSEPAAESEEAVSEPEPDDEPVPSGDLAEGQIMILPGREPPTLDPHLSGDAASAEYVVEIYSGLMAYDQDLNLKRLFFPVLLWEAAFHTFPCIGEEPRPAHQSIDPNVPSCSLHSPGKVFMPWYRFFVKSYRFRTIP